MSPGLMGGHGGPEGLGLGGGPPFLAAQATHGGGGLGGGLQGLLKGGSGLGLGGGPGPTGMQRHSSQMALM